MDQNTQPTTESRDDLGNTPPKWKKGGYEDDSTHDAVFGEISSEGPDYRSYLEVGLVGTAGLMMKTQIGLGVLSIPATFDALGLIPGVLCLIAIGLITTWSDCVIGVFKLRHRHVYAIDDAGAMMFGRAGGEFFGFIMWLILMVTIATGVQDRPDAAPQEGTWVSDYELFKTPTFVQAVSAVCAYVSAYGGTPGFFAIVAEMRKPEQYNTAVAICQSIVTALYVMVGIVMYYFCGSYVSSPALGSAGVVIKKASYGVAIPGLIVSITLVSHLPAKYMLVRFLRNTKHLTSNSAIHWATWLGCTFCVTIIAYIIASAIPIFYALVSLIGALLGSLLSFHAMGFMWFYDNWEKRSASPRWLLACGWSIFVIAAGTVLMVAGTYGSILDIIKAYKATGGAGAWSCADNSNST
ncbi:hypothetical protein ACHAPK_010774 [Fusarium culmorum]